MKPYENEIRQIDNTIGSCQVTKRGQILEEIDNLSKEIDTFSKNISILENRLSPIINIAENCPETCKEEPGKLCDLASLIRQNRIKIENLHERTSELIDRIEL